MARMELVVCKQCGKERLIQRTTMFKPYYTGLCQDCARRSRVRQGNPNWKEGQYKAHDGYIRIRLYPNNPYYTMTTKHDHYVLEHRLVMAKHLGRCLLFSERVHHKGTKYSSGSIENRSDNRIENLELIEPNGYHRIAFKRGYQDGYAQGYQDGLAKSKKKWGIK